MILLLDTVNTALEHPEKSVRSLGANFHDDLIDFIHHDAPKIVFILFVAFVLQQVVSFFVKRMRVMADNQVGNSKRAAQLRTLSSILRATAYGAITFLVLLEILPLFNIDLKPLLASAGVVGLGISFGAQSIFKDVLNGVFIFIEDQFNVGDVVKLAGLTGQVEDLTLRATTLRDGDGTQYFIPNSQIATVSNLSREYSVASLPVSVDASADPDRVMALLRKIADEVRNDKAFADVVIADADILGVDKIVGREVIYPVNLRVRANQKDGVLRALRRKVLIAFEKEEIPLGVSSSTILMQQKADPTQSPAQPTLGEG
ncbi:mechanosensitive ion channel family protein [Terriglobus saanensis]|uniref:MscS Mechanosensitive ion channel n=1 Tax=Terriglobus saanensis (strain ATCC BAA-1853 / DSM 23119 / SP1PR4) TaxID=401053 RepID=E8V7A4_TERSS|nr:mechanosensitive ion channel family protein [Terriglobus saanensis]ADV82817.1 MscS Mechanosensitive ion channel [Terriglobus saanensis SP1PR4]